MTAIQAVQRDFGAQESNRALLKRATSGAHRSVESAWFPSAGFQGFDGYREWLLALYKVHNTLGQSAAHTLGRENWIVEESARMACLVRDTGLQPQAAPPAKLGSESWAWGVLYAINGSALGGAVLLRDPSLHESWPKAYLKELGAFAKSGGVKSFFDELNKNSITARDAINGALAVFATLEKPAA